MPDCCSSQTRCYRLAPSRAVLLLILVAVNLAVPASGFAFSSWGPFPPLSQRISDEEIAVVVTCLSSKRDNPDHADARKAELGTSVFQINWVAKGPASLAPDQQIALYGEPVRQRGVRYLMFGAKSARGIDWDIQAQLSLAMIRYLQEAPDPLAPPASRFPYYLNCLESTNPEIAADAFEVFAQASFDELEAGSSALAPEGLRVELQNSELPIALHGIYGLLLGFCGDDGDIPLLEEFVLRQSDEYRMGLERLMLGYLLLAKEKGLDILDKHKLRNDKIPFQETFAAMQALRVLWQSGQGRFAPGRLQKSMHILLERPVLSDLAIADLTRWKDWSVQDRIMQIYGQKEYNIPAVERAIVRYFIVSSLDRPLGAGLLVPSHSAQSSKYLEELRKKDPKRVAEVERFFQIPLRP